MPLQSMILEMVSEIMYQSCMLSKAMHWLYSGNQSNRTDMARTGPREEAWEEGRIGRRANKIFADQLLLVCTYPRGAVPPNTTLSANHPPSIPAPSPCPARPAFSKRRDSFSFFLLMTFSFAGLGIMSIQRSIAHWSDIMHGKGEIRSIFFALLLFVVVLVLGESLFCSFLVGHCAMSTSCNPIHPF